MWGCVKIIIQLPWHVTLHSPENSEPLRNIHAPSCFLSLAPLMLSVLSLPSLNQAPVVPRFTQVRSRDHSGSAAQEGGLCFKRPN